MPNPQLRELKIYNQYLVRTPLQFPCLHCGNLVLPRDYEKHCTTHHLLDSKLNCVWCAGQQSWPKGKKNLFADHLLDCWKKFKDLYVKPPPPSPSVPPTYTIPFDMTPMCEPRNFFNHYKIPNLPERAFGEIWPMPPDPLPNLPFQYDSLNRAASLVQKYLTRPDLELFHAMVRAIAIPSFLKAMDEDGGVSQTCEYRSWCDGGNHEQAIHRQHLHLIILSKKGHFKKNVWSKISIPPEDRPCSNFKCILLKPIASALHLVNLMGYLSQRESRCNFSFKDKQSDDEKQNHFWISSPLPAHYKIVLAMQWDGGLMELIHQEQRRLDPRILAQAPIFRHRAQWQIKVKDIPGILLNIILPISKQFRLCSDPTKYFLHLNNGQKLFFEPCADGERDVEVLVHHVVGEDIWIPCAYQQKVLNVSKPFIDWSAELLAENIELKRTVDALKRKGTQTFSEKNESPVKKKPTGLL